MKPRRTFWRRLARLLACLVAFLLLAVIAGWFYLRSCVARPRQCPLMRPLQTLRSRRGATGFIWDGIGLASEKDCACCI